MMCENAVGAAGSMVTAALQFFAATQCMLSEPWPANTVPNNGSFFDFIIVGGGTAGSVLAARLSEIPYFTVLLIEAGGDPPQESIIPGLKSTLMGTAYDWNFTTVNDGVSSQALIDGRQYQPRGRMLGGSGSINDMIYSRGFPHDYDDWATTLGDQWKWENVLQYFKKTENLTDENILNDPYLAQLHGNSGEIEVTGFKETAFDAENFVKAFKQLGFDEVQDLTSPEKIGTGKFSHTIRSGRRDSSLTALLNKASVRKNLSVLKNALVTKILTENNTASGVNVLIADDMMQFYTINEVIVSAGTFNTPKILQLSGIGPENHLKSLGVEMIHDLPVGDNLHDHVMVLNYIAADNGTCYSSEAKSQMDVIRYLYDRSGPLSYVSTMGAYLSLNEEDTNIPTFAFYPTCIPTGTHYYDDCVQFLRLNENICYKLQSVLNKRELISVAAVLLKPKSRGRVRLSSTDPLDEPLIYSGTFSDESDLDMYPEAIGMVRSLVETSYFKSKKAEFVELDVDVCKGKEGEDGVRCMVKAIAMSAWHSVGSAAMGTVLNGKLQVRGVKGLRVVDASVMPRVTRGNTNAPVVMIAEQAADFIKADYTLLEKHKFNKIKPFRIDFS